MADDETTLCLLVEIISCRDLIIRDKRAKSSDPYIKIKLGAKDLHETKPVKKTLNPSFGESQHHAFILDIPAKDLFYHDGLIFKAKDHNRMSSDEDLGLVHVPAMDLYKASAAPMEYSLVAPPDIVKASGGLITTAGTILIQVSPATEAHLKKYGSSSSKKGLLGFVGKIHTQAKSQVHDVMDHIPSPKNVFHSKRGMDGSSRSHRSNHSGGDISVLAEESENGSVKAAILVLPDDVGSASTEQPKKQPKKADDKSNIPAVIEENEPSSSSAAAAPIIDPDCNPELGEELHLSIEIVSCRNLISADKNGFSDPYVKIQMGGNDLHKTKHHKKTLNPDYTEETDNKFAFHCYATDLVELGGLTFKVKDWDRLGSNDDLGIVLVPAKDIYMSSKGDNVEYKLTPPKGHENQDAGSITIRTTQTSAEDHTGEKKNLLDMIKPDIKIPIFSGLKGTVLSETKSAFGIKDKSIEGVGKPVYIEIVGCTNLIAADKNGQSDPYVKVKLGKKDLHETKPVMKTLNPAFSLQENSTFIFEESPEAVKKNAGLTFKVKDWDRVGANDDLGEVIVDHEALYSGTGENLNLKIKPPKGSKEDAGTLTIRCRPATDEDKADLKTSFLKVFSKTLAPSTREFGDLDLSLLVEVVSCWNLPSSALDASDPYVKMSIGSRVIHRTKQIDNTRDPIYTIKQDSVFILNVATKEIKARQGVTISVKDYDLIGKNDDLGQVVVPGDTFLEASGERLEFQLKDHEKDAGFIALRIRPATAYDREFLQSIGGKGDFMGIRSSTTKAMVMEPLGGARTMLKGMVTKTRKDDNGVKKFKIRPCPDPLKPKATEFLSAAQIEKEAFQDSRNWLDIGSGDLGKIFVEIIGCDGLPNKDMDIGNGNKTDAFISLVYEDCHCSTDVVDDCLSPRWLPWMKRAFVFNMMHTSSNLNIGVFDYDPGYAGDHDICGRVSVDLANFLPDTEYILRYPIYEDSVSMDRQAQGVLIVRLRMELLGEKDLIISNLKNIPIPEFYVNVKKGKDYDLVRQTVGGRHDLTSYSTKTIGLYGEELLGYQVAQYYLIDSVISLLLWRGQVPLFGINWPFHSLYFFFTATTLAARPWLWPSFFFFNIAWFLIALQLWRKASANPWHKSKTFLGLSSALISGHSYNGPSNTIEPHQNEKESLAEERVFEERVENAQKAAAEALEERNKLLAEHESMVAEAGDQTMDNDISTKGGGVSLDPLKFVLYPVQMILAKVCNVLRLFKNIMTWDEPYIAFLLTVACMALGLVFLFVPWAFLFRWTSKILAWVVFGPHMKLVDVYYYSKLESLTKDERDKQLKEVFANELKTAQMYASIARIQRENATKLKVVKQHMYGKFITRVPVLRMERFQDFPLHTSTAKPYEPRPMPTPERVSGQHLVGTMIPRIMEHAVENDKVTETKEDEKKKK